MTTNNASYEWNYSDTAGLSTCVLKFDGNETVFRPSFRALMTTTAAAADGRLCAAREDKCFAAGNYLSACKMRWMPLMSSQLRGTSCCSCLHSFVPTDGGHAASPAKMTMKYSLKNYKPAPRLTRLDSSGSWWSSRIACVCLSISFLILPSHSVHINTAPTLHIALRLTF